MKKVAKLTQKDRREIDLKERIDLTEQIRTDAVNDLESLTADFQHMTLVIESIQRNYQALLSENRLLKDTLLKLVEDCYCWQGNRCDRCRNILQVLAGEKPPAKPDALQEYKAILKQLRKLG
ncbi:MAG: hypothetical protein ACM37W_11845 [Actinomycetota bacterium]